MGMGSMENGYMCEGMKYRCGNGFGGIKKNGWCRERNIGTGM